MMDALQCIRARRSVRDYSDRKIGNDVLEKIVDAGRLAPTANNNQLWAFVVVTKKDVLAKIGSVATHGEFIMRAAACILVFCRENKHYLEDGCAATENMIIAAKGLGLGSCWVPGDGQKYSEEVRLVAGVPRDHALVSIVSLGYPDPDAAAPEKPKKRLDEVLHWERF